MLDAPALEQGAVADYLDHFGLQEDPFLDHAGELFDGANRRDQFEQLVHLCQFSTSVLAVVGERGMGKSVFKRELLQRIDDNEIVVDMAAPVLNDPQQLLIDIAHAFNLSPNVTISRDEPEQVVDQLVELIGQFGSTAEDDDPLKILIIDEAHQLDEQSLSALMRVAQYQDEDHRCLHIILFGENMFGIRLVQCAKQDQMVQVFHLETLSREDLRSYLRFRLDLAGFSGIFPFSEDDIHFLHDVSQGIPSAVHEPAREILIEMAMPEPEERRLGLPFPHMAIIVVLAAGLLLLLLFSASGDDELDTIPLAVETGKQQQSVGKNKPGEKTDSISQPVANPVVAGDHGSTGLGLTEHGSSNYNQAESRPDTGTVALEQDSKSSQSASESIAAAVAEAPKLPASNELSPLSSKAQVAESKSAKDNRANLPPPLSPDSPQATPQIKPQQKTQLSSAPSTAPVATTPSKTPSNRSEAPTKPQGIEAAMLADAEAELFTIDERRLLDTPADKYTLQVLSGTVREAVDDYIVRQSNSSQLRVYSAKRNGKVVYIVVAGVFPSLELAREAINQLPDVQRKAGAWPRPLGSVHKDINTFKGQL